MLQVTQILQTFDTPSYKPARQTMCACSSTLDNYTVCNKTLIQDDRGCKLWNMAVKPDFQKSMGHEIVYKKLKYWKISSCWVLKQMTVV